MTPPSIRLSVSLLAALLCTAPAARAQMPLQADGPAAASQVTPPVFDISSVKEHKDTGNNNMRIMTKPDGYEAVNLPLKDILAQAYGIRQDLISGLPAWAESMRFDIDARVAEEDVPTLKKLSRRQRAGMLVPVLVERFHLQVHNETRTLPTYDLVVDKSGSKLKVSTAPPLPPDTPQDKIPSTNFAGRVMMGPDRFSGRGVAISALTSQLAYTVHSTVSDKTGLTGIYDIDLKWTPEDMSSAASDNGAPDQTGSIFTALREQLGLRLVSTKSPVDTLVIDHIEKPSVN